MKRSSVRVRLMRAAAAVVVGAMVLAAGTGKSWAVPLAAFSIQLDGVTLSNATAYELNAEGMKNTLRVSLRVTDDSQLARFKAGQKFGVANIEVFSNSFAQLATYILESPQVDSVRNVGDASSNVFTEEIVLTGKSLSVTRP